jgi:predicted RNase H-like HicB family nuclease
MGEWGEREHTLACPIPPRRRETPSRAAVSLARTLMAKPAKSHGVHLKVVLEPSDDGGYTVTVPALPGCASEGDSKEDALRNIREAIQLYLEDVPADSVHSERAVVEEIVV